ncbi:UNVERIFIED_CONTAM: hypothetical protein Sindi_1028600 [Sesamum indicum]
MSEVGRGGDWRAVVVVMPPIVLVGMAALGRAISRKPAPKVLKMGERQWREETTKTTTGRVVNRSASLGEDGVLFCGGNAKFGNRQEQSGGERQCWVLWRRWSCTIVKGLEP